MPSGSAARRTSSPGRKRSPVTAAGVVTTALPIAMASSTLLGTPRAIRSGATTRAACARNGRTSGTAPVSVIPSRAAARRSRRPGRRPTATNRRLGWSKRNRGSTALREPEHGVLVRPVAHVAGEGDGRAARAERAREAKRRREVRGVHAVREHQSLAPRGRDQFLERLRLGRRDEQAVIAPGRRIAIEGGEPPAFSSIYPGQRPAGVGRHLAPFLGVHIDEIDDAPQPRVRARSRGTAPSPTSRRRRSGSAGAAPDHRSSGRARASRRIATLSASLRARAAKARRQARARDRAAK